MLGTILPTKETFRLADVYAEKQRKMKKAIAEKSPELRGCEVRVVGGEVRYYDTIDQYAIVSRSGKVIWFAVRPDGDYRI